MDVSITNRCCNQVKVAAAKLNSLLAVRCICHSSLPLIYSRVIQFEAMYVSPATSLQWTYPSSCSVTPNANAAQVQFTCSETGSQKFQVTPNADAALADTFYIDVYAADSCYAWYFVTLTDPAMFNAAANAIPEEAYDTVPAKTSDLVGRIWVVDPLAADQLEAIGQAIVPSDVCP